MTSSLLQYIGVLQGVLLSLFFFLRSPGHLSNLMLGCYVFLFSTGLMENQVASNFHNLAGEIVLSFISNASYLYGPLLYLFVSYLADGTTRFPKKHIIHFSPFLLFFSISLLQILTGYQVSRLTNDILEIIQFELLVIQILTYNILSIKKLGRYQQQILQTYSNIEEKDLRWLRLLLLIITNTYILSFLLSHLLLIGVDAVRNFMIIIQIAITVCIYLLSYNVLIRPGLFNLEQGWPGEPETRIELLVDSGNTKENPSSLLNNSQATNQELPPVSKYKKSGLKPEQAQQFLVVLQKLMNEEKLYRRPDLNIHYLANRMDISKNHLTQIINEQLSINFFEFINQYRVEEAKLLLAGPTFSHLNLQGVAVQSGFKSKTTFFTNFKKITGSTPQEWAKKSGKNRE